MYTPVMPAQTPDAAKLPGQMSASILEKEGCTTRRIVHVDDDPDIRDTVKRILDANGYAVDSYQTMNDFMTLATELIEPPDLGDSRRYGGDDGCRAGGLRGHSGARFPQLHMIFMTSLGQEIRPYFTGLSDEWILIVEKPVEPVSLLSIVRSRLGQTRLGTCIAASRA